jgi:hypothetical protein
MRALTPPQTQPGKPQWPGSAHVLSLKGLFLVTGPSVSSFLDIPHFPSTLTDLSIDNTAISSFSEAPQLPKLSRFSCRGSPLVHSPNLFVNSIVAFAAPLLKFLNGTRVSPSETSRAASSEFLRSYLLDGFLIAAFDPPRLRNPATGKRVTVYDASHHKLPRRAASPAAATGWLPRATRSRVVAAKGRRDVYPMDGNGTIGPFRLTPQDLQVGFNEVTRWSLDLKWPQSPQNEAQQEESVEEDETASDRASTEQADDDEPASDDGELD